MLSNLILKISYKYFNLSVFFHGWADTALKKSIDFDEWPDPNSIRCEIYASGFNKYESVCRTAVHNGENNFVSLEIEFLL
jgi:hypothetical protein